MKAPNETPELVMLDEFTSEDWARYGNSVRSMGYSLSDCLLALSELFGSGTTSDNGDGTFSHTWDLEDTPK